MLEADLKIPLRDEVVTLNSVAIDEAQDAVCSNAHSYCNSFPVQLVAPAPTAFGCHMKATDVAVKFTEAGQGNT
jgi:hypothetical protein